MLRGEDEDYTGIDPPLLSIPFSILALLDDEVKAQSPLLADEASTLFDSGVDGVRKSFLFRVIISSVGFRREIQR